MLNEYERALSALYYLDPSCSRDEWIRIGMAVKYAGLSFDIFNSWSSNGSNYKGKKDCFCVWQSFKEDGGITESTLFGFAIKLGWLDPNKSHDSQNLRDSSNDKNVNDIWERCAPALSTHEYIMRKQGVPDGLRYYPSSAPLLEIKHINVSGYLVVPCFQDDKLQTLQFISPSRGGEKLNLTGASFNDGYYMVGTITQRIYICEGIGQAWAIHQSTCDASVVCFGAMRIKRVARKLRDKYADASLVIVPDRGVESLAVDVATLMSCQVVTLPEDLPENYDVNDYAQEYGYVKLENLLTSPKYLTTNNTRFVLLTADDILKAPPMRWLVRGVFPLEGLGVVYGSSGSGKSFLVLDMACAIASGESTWFGRRITQVPVIYICLEGEVGLRNRLAAWVRYHNKPIPECIRFITEPFDLLCGDVDELANVIWREGVGSGLVIIDTLNRAISGADENSSSDMGEIIAATKRLQNKIGGFVLPVHHAGKDTSRGMRGHSSLYAALDGAVEVINSNHQRQWIVAKSKDDMTEGAHSFKLEILPVGSDADGDEMTSCVVVPSEDFGKTVRRVPPPKAGNQKIIWDALGELFRESRYFGQGDAPHGKSCLRLDEAIEKTKVRLIVEQKRQCERAKAAFQGLVARGLLGHKNGWIWTI